jgi:calcium-dependent protein kinase
MLRTLEGKHHCLRLLGVYETNKSIYVVTELCAGGEMMEYVSRQEELRTEDVSRIVYQLLDAVHHCASHGIIHRDVKPENVMFCHKTAASELRLIDFGSGCMDVVAPAEQPDRAMVVHSTFAGSAFYISPEMFQRTYTAKTDVWSCGVVVYVLVAGYPADELQKAFNILHKSKNRNLKSLPNLPHDMPDSFYHLLEELLEYRHKGRKSAGELLQHEFVQFHTKLLHDANPPPNLDISHVVAESLTTPTTTSETASEPTKSMRLTSSVQRHSMFMDFKKFERSVTTLLATLLSKQELNLLLQKLESGRTNQEQKKEKDIQVSSGHDDDDDDVAKVSKKLNIIPISELETMLEEMKQTKCLDNIHHLPNAANYKNFAYHVELLAQFQREHEILGASGLERRHSFGGEKETNSVHGSDVFQNSRRKGASSMATGKRDNLNNSWHLGQSVGGGGSMR